VPDVVGTPKLPKVVGTNSNWVAVTARLKAHTCFGASPPSRAPQSPHVTFWLPWALREESWLPLVTPYIPLLRPLLLPGHPGARPAPGVMLRAVTSSSKPPFITP
jgi:hypothetical protein